MARIGTRRALLYRASGAAANWWDVAGQTCVAAYQPKGAADLAASYVNLANPGTYNAAPGTAPSFDTATGWQFAQASLQYLDTGIVPTNNQAWSVIARYSNLSLSSYDALIRKSDGAANTLGFLLVAGNQYYGNGGQLAIGATAASAGVYAVAGATGYKNGTAEAGTIGAPSGTSSRSLYIGASNEAALTHYLTGYIQAVAIYSTTLSASDVAALTTRMNAL